MLGFLTDSRLDYAEAAGLLTGVDVTWLEDLDACAHAGGSARLASPVLLPQGSCVRPCHLSSHCTVDSGHTFNDELARRAALLAAAACESTGLAVFTVEWGLHLEGGGAFPGGGRRSDLETCGAEAFCRAQAGRRGLVRLMLAYTEDGETAAVFESDVPGQVARQPSPTGASDWSSVWLPNGYGRTFAELAPNKYPLNKRGKLYVDLANYLGLEVCDDVYEAHVTTSLDTRHDRARFVRACDALGVKAIHVELPYGVVRSQHITGSFHRGPFGHVKRQVQGIADHLTAERFTVTRVKIEAMVRNHLVPLTDEDGKSRPPSNYFEFHVKALLRANDDQGELEGLCRPFGAHVSRTASNRFEDGAGQRFVTLRVYRAGRGTAEEKFAELLTALSGAGYALTNRLREYTVYDTNAGLDDGWYAVDSTRDDPDVSASSISGSAAKVQV